ncbi:LLM class flavin-dependent oxidoreductase [Streptomyces cuspidosporus]|uniref:LLM class flavin-dependent oxidoreductase n=1 Tax=Streptomyces cuspidosporus TaxID=66882 RepID=A0ABN3FTD5_9ACTN
MSGVRLGALVLPEHAWSEGRAVWSRLEALGLDHAWTFDHLSWRTLRGRPWYDALVTLTAAACATRRITLGTLVSTPNFRHPLPLAHQVTTLDDISGGRFVLGLGAGAPGPDATALGGARPAPAAAAERFEEFVPLLDRLVRGAEVTHHGRFFDVAGTRLVPGCARPRFAVAATGPRGMRLAAAHAGMWVTNGPVGDPGALDERALFRLLAAQLERLEAVCERTGRDFSGLRKLVHVSRFLDGLCFSAERIVDAVGRCAELGFTDVVVAHPRREGVLAGDPAAFEEAVCRLTGAPAPTDLRDPARP